MDQERSKKEVSSARPGDERTPDRRIGEVAYADNLGKKTPKEPSEAARQSELEGPAAYAPHDEGEKIGKRQKSDTPPDGGTQGGVGSQGGM